MLRCEPFSHPITNSSRPVQATGPEHPRPSTAMGLAKTETQFVPLGPHFCWLNPSDKRAGPWPPGLLGAEGMKPRWVRKHHFRGSGAAKPTRCQRQSPRAGPSGQGNPSSSQAPPAAGLPQLSKGPFARTSRPAVCQAPGSSPAEDPSAVQEGRECQGSRAPR